MLKPNENKAIKDFFIHPQTKEELTTLKAKVQGVPAQYQFAFQIEGHSTGYELTCWVEGASYDETSKNAKAEIRRRGFTTGNITLTLKHLQNKIYGANRGVTKG